MLRRAVTIAVHVALFAGFGACNFLVAGWLATARSSDDAVTCLGQRHASRHVVYLHGLDSYAPSWQELDNRRALAAIPDVEIALPRAPACGGGRCWPDTDDRTRETIDAIRDAARTCFDDHESYGVLGFSRGGFAIARLASCRAAGARWAIVASAFGYTEELRLRDCPVAVVVGRHDRYQLDGALGYAQRRRTAGLPGSLFQFDGSHRLDTESLAAAISALEESSRAR